MSGGGIYQPPMSRRKQMLLDQQRKEQGLEDPPPEEQNTAPPPPPAVVEEAPVPVKEETEPPTTSTQSGSNTFVPSKGSGKGGKGRKGYKGGRENEEGREIYQPPRRHNEGEGQVPPQHRDHHRGRGPEYPRTSWGNLSVDEYSFEKLYRNTRHAAGLNFDKYKDIPVEVTGPEPTIKPLEDFADSGLAELLLENVERCKYRVPTPIQKYSVPSMLSGLDVMACAQTGSGKTAAFLFPIIHLLLTCGPCPYKKRLARGQVAPESLVLAPTRELAVQIFEESQKFIYQTGLRSVAVYGGIEMRGQMQDLEKGCQILVATPGRLIDLCTPRPRPGKGGNSSPVGTPKVSLSNIYVVCIDEADRMLDMGFDVQMRQIMKQRDMPPLNEIQTMMFSATFPAAIQRLAQEFLTSPYYFIQVGVIGSTNTGITQTLEYCPESGKAEFLLALLRHHCAEAKKLVLIFVDTKVNANQLVLRLQDEGLRATTIHGDRTQQEREAALHAFKRGESPILVATDVASRGLDIPNVSHVVQYDLASNLDDYTHRIGRTGRAGNTGMATAFFNEKNRAIAKSLLTYLQEHSQKVPQKLVDIVASMGAGRPGKGAAGKGGKGGKKGEKEAINTISSGRTVSRKQLLQEKAAAEAAASSSYNAGNMLFSMMGGGGGQY